MNLFLWTGIKHFHFTTFRYPRVQYPFQKIWRQGIFFVFWPFRGTVKNQYALYYPTVIFYCLPVPGNQDQGKDIDINTQLHNKGT